MANHHLDKNEFKEFTAPPTPKQHNPKKSRPQMVGADSPQSPYPVYMKGPVQKGFGRGSKDLGCPTGKNVSNTSCDPTESHQITANLPDEAISPYTSILDTGVHCGYARVDFSSRNETEEIHSRVYPMVMSIGWNPFYKNIKRTAVGEQHFTLLPY